MATPDLDHLHAIVAKFGKDFKDVQQPEHAWMDNVYILDNAFVLKGRPLNEVQRNQIYRENALLTEIAQKVPFALPLLLPTMEGHPFLETEDRLWTLADYIPRHTMGTWQNVHSSTEAEMQSIFKTLRMLHERTTGISMHEHTDLDAFIRVRTSELGKTRHLVSAHVHGRIAQALNRVHESRKNLSTEETCFIHGDFHNGNIIVDDRKNIVGLIDFDFCRIGHPFEDVGTTVQMAMDDYRTSSFVFCEDYFHQLLGWYGISKEDHSLFIEYFLIAGMFAVWDFFSSEGTANRDFYLQYHLSMLHNLATRFGSEHDMALPVQTGPVKFPVDLSEKYLALATELQIHPKDISERFVRGSGHGGQKINKTSSCVELHHAPSGVSVRVQEFREQHKNRMEAYKRLILKVEEKLKGKESSKAQEVFKIRKQKARRGRKSKEKMLKEKKLRGEVKKNRQKSEL